MVATKCPAIVGNRQEECRLAFSLSPYRLQDPGLGISAADEHLMIIKKLSTLVSGGSHKERLRVGCTLY